MSNENLFAQLQLGFMETSFVLDLLRVQSYLGYTTEMTNSTNYTVPYEYYMDYFDLPPVDASKLKANRYSIVIGFWIGLVFFVAFLFFILFYMSRSGTTSMKTGGSKKFPWNYSETIHQNLVNNDTVRTSVDNQGEEIEGLCSSNRLPCHHMDNSV